MSLREDFLKGGGCPVIDMHGHLGPFYGIYMPEAQLETMAAQMDRYGYECIVLSPHSALSGDAREGNGEMLDAAEKYPGRILGYCTYNPNFTEDSLRDLDRYLPHPGVAGIKIHPSMHACSATDKRYGPLWERADAEKRIVLSHTWGTEGGCGTKEMRQVAEQYPSVRLILGHACYGAWAEAIALAAEFPNVYLELTAAYHVYGILEWMCREAGSGKVLFGTDYPWFDPFVAIGCVVYAHIGESEMLDILYHNARRLLDEQNPCRP